MELYSVLLIYGTFIELKSKIDGQKLVKWTEENFEYVRYNPRKNIDRYGLSITSLDGSLSGIPDLDSLYEYNLENGTTYQENDFTVPTDVYKNNKELQELLLPWKDYIFRTHIIKLNPGGYFPPHRDFFGLNIDSFRLISPLVNACPFVLEDKLLRMREGNMYFIDTAKVHQLFNSNTDPSYWLVVNVKLNKESLYVTCKDFKN